MRKAIHFKAMMCQECSIPLERFSDLMGLFLKQAPDTLDIENFALDIRQQDFQDQGQVREFIQSVCGWGNYSGIGGRVLLNNTLEQIADTLRRATAVLEQQEPDIGNALQIVKELNGLACSFASKHLRILFPNLCPVLDSIISERMFYPSDIEGYRAFGTDCTMIAGFLTNEAIPHPIAARQETWYPADVEASIYAFLRG